MYKKGRVNSNSRIISTDEDPSLRIESSAIINLRGVSTKLNKYRSSTVFKCSIPVGLVSLVVYARCSVLEVAGSNPTPASFSFQLLFNFFSIFFLKLFL